MDRDEAAYAEGIEAATDDIAARRLVYRWHGHAGHWGHWIVTQLDERFGVSVGQGFGICFMDAATSSFAAGYNSVLAAEIDRRFGAGAFEAVFREARDQSEEALGDAKRAWLARYQDAAPRDGTA